MKRLCRRRAGNSTPCRVRRLSWPWRRACCLVLLQRRWGRPSRASPGPGGPRRNVVDRGLDGRAGGPRHDAHRRGDKLPAAERRRDIRRFKDPSRKLPPPEQLKDDNAVIFGYRYPAGASSTTAAMAPTTSSKIPATRPAGQVPARHISSSHTAEHQFQRSTSSLIGGSSSQGAMGTVGPTGCGAVPRLARSASCGTVCSRPAILKMWPIDSRRHTAWGLKARCWSAPTDSSRGAR
jgi:hypothetical protein